MLPLPSYILHAFLGLSPRQIPVVVVAVDGERVERAVGFVAFLPNEPSTVVVFGIAFRIFHRFNVLRVIADPLVFFLDDFQTFHWYRVLNVDGKGTLFFKVQ